MPTQIGLQLTKTRYQLKKITVYVYYFNFSLKQANFCYKSMQNIIVRTCNCKLTEIKKNQAFY